MKFARLRVFVELSNGAWIEKAQDCEGKRITCGGGDIQDNFDEYPLDSALDELEKVVIE